MGVRGSVGGSGWGRWAGAGGRGWRLAHLLLELHDHALQVLPRLPLPTQLLLQLLPLLLCLFQPLPQLRQLGRWGRDTGREERQKGRETGTFHLG